MLEQAVDFAGVDIDVDAAEAWIGTRAGHQFDVAGDWNDEARALVDENVADGQGEAARAAFDGRIVGEAEVRLDHACAHAGQFRILRELFELLLRGGQEFDALCSIYFLRNEFDTFFERRVEIVEEMEVVRFVRGGLDGFGQFDGAFAAFEPMFRKGGVGARLFGDLADEGDFRRRFLTVSIWARRLSQPFSSRPRFSFV